MSASLRDRLAERLPAAEDTALSAEDCAELACEFGTSYAAVKRALWALVDRGVAGVDEWGFYRRGRKS